jgi:hypothetical protein
MSHIRAIRSYRGREAIFQCTLLEAAWATMATQGLFEPAHIGQGFRKQEYVGVGTTFGNPTDQILKEARSVYGNSCRISVILSIGTGIQVALSQEKMAESIGPANILSHIAFHCDATAKTLNLQLENVHGYLRLNVDKGTGQWSEDDWRDHHKIGTNTSSYLEEPRVTKSIDQSVELLISRQATATVGQLSNCKHKFFSRIPSQTAA